MARSLRSLEESDLEIALLRKTVDRLEADRPVCADCGRTPLIGERVFTFARAATVCALCRPGRTTQPEGDDLVHHAERGITVRRIVPSAV